MDDKYSISKLIQKYTGSKLESKELTHAYKSNSHIISHSQPSQVILPFERSQNKLRSNLNDQIKSSFREMSHQKERIVTPKPNRKNKWRTDFEYYDFSKGKEIMDQNLEQREQQIIKINEALQNQEYKEILRVLGLKNQKGLSYHRIKKQLNNILQFYEKSVIPEAYLEGLKDLLKE